ncbi:putative alcohol dehydrogenase [Xylaria palmicola]|nr:putative alcohol dehydrogenase [Xylaria palmicola]
MTLPGSLPQRQKAIVQRRERAGLIPLQLQDDVAVPALSSPHGILVRVLAVGLNHCDYKMPTNFPVPGGMAGCDFCGIVVVRGSEAWCETGARVCGGVFPYGRSAGSAATSEAHSGAFAQFVAVDSRVVLGVPASWSDVQGAALGAVGWGTVGLALSDPNALALDGFPSTPAGAAQREPVLVYGGATATGTIACQLLSLSGHVAIAVTSPQSASLAIRYDASATASYTSPTCAADVRAQASEPVRHALDCITSAESAATCFAALARTGGRYACVESFQEAWRSRRAVRVKEVMGYEGLGRSIQFEAYVESPNLTTAAAAAAAADDDDGCNGGSSSVPPPSSTYTRKANAALATLCARWAYEMRRLLDAGLIKHHPVREIEGRWDGIIDGLLALQRGEVRCEKLVIRIADQ